MIEDFHQSGASYRGRKKDRDQSELIKKREKKRRAIETAKEIEEVLKNLFI